MNILIVVLFLGIVEVNEAFEEEPFYVVENYEDILEGFESKRMFDDVQEIRYIGIQNLGGKKPTEERTGRIIGGERAIPNEFPFMVRTFLYLFNGTIVTWCGGVLINSKFILSAAHCFFNGIYRQTKLFAILGDHSRYVIEPTEVTIPIEKCIVRDFNEETNYGDLMLCELMTNVQLTKEIQPACIPKQNKVFAKGTAVTAIGWGCMSLPATSYSDVLRKVEIYLLPHFHCRIRVKGYSAEVMICAGGRGRNTCPGDSGGPIFLKMKNKFLVMGLTSFGNSRLVGPVVYTRVSRYTRWIVTLGSKGGEICVL